MSGKRNRSKKNSAVNSAKYTYRPDILSKITQQSLETTARAVAQQRQTAAPQPQPDTVVSAKYYLTNDVIDVDGHKLHRIVAARDIPEIGVQEGDLGGYVESERNLSHQGTAWIFAGKVYEQACVIDGATVRGNNVHIHDTACLSGGFIAYDDAHLYGNFRGTGCGKAAGRVDACDNTIIKGSGFATDGTIMRHKATVGGNARAAAGAILTGNVELTGNFEAIGGHYSQGVLGRFPGTRTESPARDNVWQDDTPR